MQIFTIMLEILVWGFPHHAEIIVYYLINDLCIYLIVWVILDNFGPHFGAFVAPWGFKVVILDHFGPHFRAFCHTFALF